MRIRQATLRSLWQTFAPPKPDLPPRWLTREQAERLRALGLDVAQREGLSGAALGRHPEIVAAWRAARRESRSRGKTGAQG